MLSSTIETTFFISLLLRAIFDTLTARQAATEVQIQQKYGASQVTASSGLTVYVLGFSFGPLFCEFHLPCQPQTLLSGLNVTNDTLLFVGGERNSRLFECARLDVHANSGDG